MHITDEENNEEEKPNEDGGSQYKNIPSMKSFEAHFIDSNEPLAYLKRVKFIEASEEYERKRKEFEE